MARPEQYVWRFRVAELLDRRGVVFPRARFLGGGPNVVLSYIGLETRNGESVQHIQSYMYQPNQSALTPTPQQLSTMDFYLDAITFLPSAVTFNAHPDNNATANLLLEVDFSNYQAVNGVVVPMPSRGTSKEI